MAGSQSRPTALLRRLRGSGDYRLPPMQQLRDCFAFGSLRPVSRKPVRTPGAAASRVRSWSRTMRISRSSSTAPAAVASSRDSGCGGSPASHGGLTRPPSAGPLPAACPPRRAWCTAASSRGMSGRSAQEAVPVWQRSTVSRTSASPPYSREENHRSQRRGALGCIVGRSGVRVVDAYRPPGQAGRQSTSIQSARPVNC